MDVHARARIRALNDQLRQHHEGGRLYLTAGFLALGGPLIAEALAEIATFDRFGPRNDP